MATRDETKKMVEVMQAYIAGKKIQTTNWDGEWEDIDNGDAPVWDWFESEYRVAPETSEVFQVRYPEWNGKTVRTFLTLRSAEEVLDELEHKGVKAEFAILHGEFKPYPNGDNDDEV